MATNDPIKPSGIGNAGSVAFLGTSDTTSGQALEFRRQHQCQLIIRDFISMPREGMLGSNLLIAPLGLAEGNVSSISGDGNIGDDGRGNEEEEDDEDIPPLVSSWDNFAQSQLAESVSTDIQHVSSSTSCPASLQVPDMSMRYLLMREMIMRGCIGELYSTTLDYHKSG